VRRRSRGVRVLVVGDLCGVEQVLDPVRDEVGQRVGTGSPRPLERGDRLGDRVLPRG
jgi:hypothetical protein